MAKQKSAEDMAGEEVLRLLQERFGERAPSVAVDLFLSGISLGDEPNQALVEYLRGSREHPQITEILEDARTRDQVRRDLFEEFLVVAADKGQLTPEEVSDEALIAPATKDRLLAEFRSVVTKAVDETGDPLPREEARGFFERNAFPNAPSTADQRDLERWLDFIVAIRDAGVLQADEELDDEASAMIVEAYNDLKSDFNKQPPGSDWSSFVSERIGETLEEVEAGQIQASAADKARQARLKREERRQRFLQSAVQSGDLSATAEQDDVDQFVRAADEFADLMEQRDLVPGERFKDADVIGQILEHGVASFLAGRRGTLEFRAAQDAAKEQQKVAEEREGTRQDFLGEQFQRQKEQRAQQDAESFALQSRIAQRSLEVGLGPGPTGGRGLAQVENQDQAFNEFLRSSFREGGEDLARFASSKAPILQMEFEQAQRQEQERIAARRAEAVEFAESSPENAAAQARAFAPVLGRRDVSVGQVAGLTPQITFGSFLKEQMPKLQKELEEQQAPQRPRRAASLTTTFR